MDADALAREKAHLKARLVDAEAALAEVRGKPIVGLKTCLADIATQEVRQRSEKLLPDQFNLPLEDAELTQGMLVVTRGRGPRPC